MTSDNPISLRQLLRTIQRQPETFAEPESLRQLIAPLVKAMGGDDDACVLASDRATIRAVKYTIRHLLYTLCHSRTMERGKLELEATCETLNCVNPRHKRPRVEFQKRRKTHRRTQVDEQTLRRHYPMNADDLKASACGPHFVNKRRTLGF